jgi:hypothetical protein
MVSNLYELVVSLLESFINLPFPAIISQNSTLLSSVNELTSLAQYHTIANISQAGAQLDLGVQGSSHLQQAVCHPSWSLGSLEAVLLSAPSPFQRTTNTVRESPRFL